MKLLNVLFAVTALSVSGLAMAEGGSDRVLARMEQGRQASQEADKVAQQQKDGAPVAAGHDKQHKHPSC